MIYINHGKQVEGEWYDKKYGLPRITFPQVIDGDTVAYFDDFEIEPQFVAVEPKLLSRSAAYKHR